MKLRFDKAQKIKRKSEISRLFKNGRRWECVCFVLIFEQNTLKHDRFGVVVSRKLGNAVRRNRVKRVFREVYRRNKPANQNPPFFDILIKPKLQIDVRKLCYHEQAEFFNTWQSKVGRDVKDNFMDNVRDDVCDNVGDDIYNVIENVEAKI